MAEVFISFLNRSISATWLVLAVCLLRLLLKAAPKKYRLYLWGIVGLRLMLPVSIKSALSLVPSASTVNENIIYAQKPSIHSGVEFIDRAVNPGLSTLTPAPHESVNPLLFSAELMAVLWLGVMAGLLIYSLASYVRLRRAVAESLPFKDNIRICAGIDSPFVLGVFRPQIYLPRSLDRECFPFVLAHERAHISRGDHVIKPLAYILLSVYWFNPLLWPAYGLMCRDIELACDERVLSEMGRENKKAYSRALLNLSMDRGTMSACPVAFGESSVKQRIKEILKYKKAPAYLSLAALLICGAVTLCFLTDPKGFSFDTVKNPAAWAEVKNSRGETVLQMNTAELSELDSRLGDLRELSQGQINAASEEPLCTLNIRFEDGSEAIIYLNGTDAYIEYNGYGYESGDRDFCAWLERLASAEIRAEASKSNVSGSFDPARYVSSFGNFVHLSIYGETEYSGAFVPNETLAIEFAAITECCEWSAEALLVYPDENAERALEFTRGDGAVLRFEEAKGKFRVFTLPDSGYGELLECSENIMDEVMTFAISCTEREEPAKPEPEVTETPTGESAGTAPSQNEEELQVRYYENVLYEFTLHAGDVVELNVVGGQGEVQWSCSKEDVLTLSPSEDGRLCTLECLQGTRGGLELTVSCSGMEKTLKVYCID